MQLREAEESGLVLRSAMAASASLGFLAFACGAFVGVLDLHLFAADAAGVPNGMLADYNSICCPAWTAVR